MRETEEAKKNIECNSQLLGEDDFVFVDANFNPKFVHNVNPDGQPEEWWLCYWLAPQREWVTQRKITEQEREAFRRRSFSHEHSELYFTNYHPKASLDTNPGEGAAKQSGKASSTLCEVGIGVPTKHKVANVVKVHESTPTTATGDRTSPDSTFIHIEHYFPKGYNPNDEPWKSIKAFHDKLYTKYFDLLDRYVLPHKFVSDKNLTSSCVKCGKNRKFHIR